jgi:fibronectin type 3 domain-containing protein
VFPPAIPTGLVAVATAADAASSTEPSIDLSWQPNTEADLVGYEVYRREDQTPWQRISGDQPAIGPAFHDAHVLAGHTYRYGVSAVDKGGHESGRSQEAQETVPVQ